MSNPPGPKTILGIALAIASTPTSEPEGTPYL